MDDQLLTRIANVSNYYRGAIWQLSFTSPNGGTWGYSLESGPPPEEGAEELPPFMARIFYGPRGRPSDEPIFAMRCQILEVICESLENWHAKTLIEQGER